jgi:UDP-3-O-[3-hydroxymyristoyl] glucosamine N-acyltransferase
MGHRLSEIAAALGLAAEGDGDILIARAAEPADAGPDDLALAMTPAYAEGLAKGSARAAMLWQGADWRGFGLQAAILVPRPRLAMAGLTRALDPGPGGAAGIHAAAVIDSTARIGPCVAIGPLTVVGPGAVIGAGARIGPQVTIGEGAVIGDDALIHAGVRIAARVTIGHRFIAQPGAVIGGDGFSFVTPEKSGAEEVRETLGRRGGIRPQSWARIHSLGGVEIGDDVEIGANACIDRGTIRATRIGSGTKIDNLVQVGHNVTIGRDCLLCGQTGIAGSVRIGDRVVLGGQTGVADNVFIGDDVITGAGTMILANAPAGRVLLGYPAMKMEGAIEAARNIRRLPRLIAEVAALRKSVTDVPQKRRRETEGDGE